MAPRATPSSPKATPADKPFFLKRAVSQVAIQLVGLGVVGDEQIGPAVAIIVEDGDAERFAGGVAQAGLLGYIFEFAAA